MTGKIVLELWQESSPKKRCPYIACNGKACYCSKSPAIYAEMVCDHLSMQLWCLDENRYSQCYLFSPREKTLD